MKLVTKIAIGTAIGVVAAGAVALCVKAFVCDLDDLELDLYDEKPAKPEPVKTDIPKCATIIKPATEGVSVNMSKAEVTADANAGTE